MAEFENADLKASTFRRVHLNDATFREVHLAGARFRNVDLSGAEFRAVGFHNVRMRGVELGNVDISGEIIDLVINGVDVGPLIQAELERRDPEYAKMRPTDPQGFREAWDIIERRWRETVAKAAAMDPALLHEQVDGEWSFIETLRHLAFATDCWLRRGIQGDPSPWHPLDLPWDRAVRPSPAEVLTLREDRMGRVRDLIEQLTPEKLAETVVPASTPGWPSADMRFPVSEALHTILNEEWEHRNYAERDLAVLQERTG